MIPALPHLPPWVSLAPTLRTDRQSSRREPSLFQSAQSKTARQREPAQQEWQQKASVRVQLEAAGPERLRPAHWKLLRPAA
jgi:hypothetical protein